MFYLGKNSFRNAYSFVDEDLKQLMQIGIIKATQMYSKNFM